MSIIRESKESLFTYGNEVEANHRVSLYVAGVSACLLLLVTIVLVAVPRDVYNVNPPKNCSSERKLPDCDYGDRASTERSCEISVESKNCKVTCDDISAGSNKPPGQIIVENIKRLFENFSGSCDKWYLMIRRTKFPNSTIQSDWFPVNELDAFPTFHGLEIEASPNLQDIEPGAFGKFPFGAYLETIVLARNPFLKTLVDGMTEGLTKLHNFHLRENGVISYVGSDLFSPFENSLQVVEIQGGVQMPVLLGQMVGTCQNSLSKIKLADLSFNNEGASMEHLGAGHLSALTKVESLFLQNSGIKDIDVDTFFGISESIVTISLADNNLETLPNGIFHWIHYNRGVVNLYLAGNDWRCDCHLKWLQDFMTDFRNISLADDAKCKSPESERGKPLISANFSSSCPEPLPPPSREEMICPCISTTMEPEVTTTISTTPIPEFECDDFRSHFILRYPVSKPSRAVGFNITEVAQDKSDFTEVVIDAGEGSGMTLVWHHDENTLSCLRGVSGLVVVKNLTKGVAYVFCLYDEGEGIETPSQCQGVKTLPSWEHRAWIENDQRSLWLAIFVVIAIACAMVGAGAVIFAIWRKPTLLAMSSRVVKVKSPRTLAVVMPNVPPRPKGLFPGWRNNSVGGISNVSSPSYFSIMGAANNSSLIKYKLNDWFEKMRNEHSPPIPDESHGNRGSEVYCELDFHDYLPISKEHTESSHM